MLKLTLRPGEFIDIGENIRVVFSGGSANNIHLLVDAPKEVNVARSSAAGRNAGKSYYREQGISDEAKKEIREILRREKNAAERQNAMPTKHMEKAAYAKKAVHAEKTAYTEKAEHTEAAYTKKAEHTQQTGRMQQGSIYVVRHK